MIKENQNQSLFLTESKTYPSETRILSIWIGIRVLPQKQRDGQRNQNLQMQKQISPMFYLETAEIERR